MSGLPTESHRGSVLLSHADVELALSRTAGKAPYGERDLRAILNLYALLYGRLIVLDSAFLFNPAIQYLISHPSARVFGYEGLLRDGVLVPLARDIAPDFRHLHGLQLQSGMFPATDWNDALAFADFLDDCVGERVQFRNREFYELYTELAEGALQNETFLEGAGIPARSAQELLAFLAREKGAPKGDLFEGVVRRSTFFRFADGLPRSREAESRRIREFGGVLGHAAMGSLLGIVPAYSAKWGRSIDALHSVQVSGAAPHDGPAVEARASDTLPFNIAALESIHYDHIAEIRASREFHDYIVASEKALATPDPVVAGRAFHEALATYLAYLEDALVVSIGRGGDTAKRFRKLVTVSTFVDVGGSVTITLVGAALPMIALPAVGLGLAWAFGGIPVKRWIESRAEKEARRARKDVLSRFPKSTSVNRGQLVVGRPRGPRPPDAG